ncbi:hypothetical protein J6590_063634 [Homalodisca vitripennis]|nr:hypothetical protein J6590_063634 [Homalodisca vitripennis]
MFKFTTQLAVDAAYCCYSARSMSLYLVSPPAFPNRDAYLPDCAILHFPVPAASSEPWKMSRGGSSMIFGEESQLVDLAGGMESGRPPTNEK